ncbi:MAG: T9SS type A sorting domain-containing protein [Tannerellaceae bacterium]|nr:T9SS type A sorting domain-containing protein [Tannerellaceae bacterium]
MVADGPIIIATPQARTATVNVPVTVTPSVTGVTNYRWAISPATSNAYLDNTYGSYAVVTFSATGSFALYGYGIYPCGESGGATVLYTFTVSSSASYSMSAYPNPVSGVLNVDLEELDAASEAFSTSGSSVSGSGGISRARPVYTISLYSVMGMLALQTVTNNPGNIQLDVSSLPSGIYTLRVHDGTDSPPVTQQIVISH